MRVGASRRDITPPHGLWMSGYGGRTVATSTTDALEVRALAVDDEHGGRALIVAADLLGFDYDFVAAARAAIEQRTGIGADGILLNASHTHCGPAVINHLVSEAPHLDLAYRERLMDSLLAAADEAWANRRPAVAACGMGACRIGINRRAPRAPFGMAPDPRGFYDATVGVLAFTDPADGRPLAVVFNATCHPTTLGAATTWSAEWPGAARRSVDAYLGDGCTSLFLQGACGNIRPRTFGFGQSGFRQGTYEELERQGHACAHEVIRLLQDALQPAAGDLTVRRLPCALPLDQIRSADDIRARAAAGEPWAQDYANHAERRWPGLDLPDTLPYEVQMLTLGEAVSIVAIPGEVVSEYAAATRAMVPRPTLFCGYSNGLPTYIPTARIRRQGGYEGTGANVFFGMPGCLREDAELVILGKIEEALG